MNFITGGTGLVGSHLLYDLLREKKNVRALNRKSSDLDFVKHVFSYYTDNYNELFKKIEWVEGDILDVFSLEDAMQDINHVYHCAATISFDPKDREKVLKINIEGTANLVNAAMQKDVKKLCHVSSIAALGRASDEEYVDENTQWETSKNNSVYAIGKYGSEREVWRATEEGLDTVIVNPSIIIGPGKWGDGSSAFFKSVSDGLKFYSTGINGFVDVRDVSKAMIMLMESDVINQRYILNAENISYEKLLNTIAQHLNVKPPSIKATKFLSEMAWRLEKVRSFITRSTSIITRETARTALSKYLYSNVKISKQFDFTFIPVEQSIKDTAVLFLKDQKDGK